MSVLTLALIVFAMQSSPGPTQIKSPGPTQVKLSTDCQAGDQKACVQLARSNATTPAVRLAAVRKLTDQSVLTDLARTCTVRNIRLAAIRGLINQDALSRIAQDGKGPGPIERGAAIERLQSQELLAQIAEDGLFAALGEGVFGDVPRRVEEGRGTEGIVETAEGYFNPASELMQGASSLA